MNCGELGCQRGTSVPKPPALYELSVTATPWSRLSSPLLQRCKPVHLQFSAPKWSLQPYPRCLGWGQALAVTCSVAVCMSKSQG